MQIRSPNARALFIRRTMPQLRDAIARSFQLFRPLGADYSKQERVWTFPNGATCEFGFLDSPDDKYNYLGRQFTLLAFDELAQLGADSVDAQGNPISSSYLYLLSRLRSPEGSGVKHEVRCATNPAGPGLGWVRARWQIPDDGSASECIDEATGFRRQFIPAKLSDNPFLRDTDYAVGLKTLAKADYKALALGRWDSFLAASSMSGIQTCTPAGPSMSRQSGRRGEAQTMVTRLLPQRFGSLWIAHTTKFT